MSNIFIGHEASLEEILLARDRRVSKQRELLNRYPFYTLVSITMNIPGKIKNSELISKVFDTMLLDVERNIPEIEYLIQNRKDSKTGREALLLVKLSNVEAKKRLISLEEGKELNRLFDLDVIYKRGDVLQQVSRKNLALPKRKCLICEKDAKVCSRSKAHTIEELQEKIERLIINE